MRIDPKKTCAIFIDYQERLVPAMSDPLFVKNGVTLATGLMAIDIPLIVSEQYPKGLGTTVPDLKDLSGFPEGIPKTTFSCMLNDDIISSVKATGAKHVIVSGCESHICVLQTVTDLIEMGYTVYLVDDCCSSRTPKNHGIGMDRAKQEGAFITSLESILFELLREAGSDAFKTISKLIK